MTPFAPGKEMTLAALLKAPAYASRFKEVLGEKAPQFVSSLMSIGASMPTVDPRSILGSAMVAAVLDLPIERNLGLAWIIPYKQNLKNADGTWGTVQRAQFQMGYKGYVQLALRSGQFARIHATAINREVFQGNDEFGEPELDFDQLDPAKDTWGYFFGFKLTTGLTKRVVWTKEQVLKHAERYSQSYRAGSDIWKEHFEPMALKTVISNTIRKWCPLSVQMQTALRSDHGVIVDVDAEPVMPEIEDSMARPEAHPAQAQAQAAKTTTSETAKATSALNKRGPVEVETAKAAAAKAKGPVETPEGTAAQEPPAKAIEPSPTPPAPSTITSTSTTGALARDKSVVKPVTSEVAEKAKAALRQAQEKLDKSPEQKAAEAEDRAQQAMGLKPRAPLVQEMEKTASEPENVVKMPEPEGRPEPKPLTEMQQNLKECYEREGYTFWDFYEWGKATINMKVDPVQMWAAFSDKNAEFLVAKKANILASLGKMREKKNK
jgi:recombination protein RecT